MGDAARPASPPAAVTALLLVGGLLVAVRSIGLAYLDLTTFPAFSPTYLAASAAVAVVLAASAIASWVGRDA